MFPLGNIGHFHLYMQVPCRVIYTIISKFLYLKNNAIFLIFKIWLGMKRKLILEIKLSTYSYTYLQVVMDLIRQTVPLSWSSFTPYFLHFNLVFRQCIYPEVPVLICYQICLFWLQLIILLPQFSWFILVSYSDLINTRVM